VGYRYVNANFLMVFSLEFNFRVAFHDVFELYGRPKSYTWDPRDPVSQMFGYPVGPHKEVRLFHLTT
jgi:hypothetical protein